MMKSTTTIAFVALLALAFQAAGDDGTSRVYRASKPSWWDSPMGCYPPNEEGVHWCGAGAWDIPRLHFKGESSIAVAGFAGVSRDPERRGLTIWTYFGDRNATFACESDGAPLNVQRQRLGQASGGIVVRFSYWVWTSRVRMEECLSKPIRMTVDGRTYRLGTKLLRQAAAKVVERAGN